MLDVVSRLRDSNTQVCDLVVDSTLLNIVLHPVRLILVDVLVPQIWVTYYRIFIHDRIVKSLLIRQNDELGMRQVILQVCKSHVWGAVVRGRWITRHVIHIQRYGVNLILAAHDNLLTVIDAVESSLSYQILCINCIVPLHFEKWLKVLLRANMVRKWCLSHNLEVFPFL